MTSDQIVIRGPSGFCVDPTHARTEGDAAFVILGNCAAISGEAQAPQPQVPAILTAAVSDRTGGGTLDGELDDLAAFFRSDSGRALLSRSNRADTVEILETVVQHGLVFIHARDTSAGAFAGVAQDYWRVYLDLGPRLATLTVLGPDGAGLEEAEGLRTLSQFAQAVRRAN